MLKIYSNTIYKRIGQEQLNIVREAQSVNKKVTGVIETLTDNSAGKFSDFRKKAEQLAKKLNITYEKAIEQLYKQGEHAIDILA